jgi:hypothetical protein
MSSTWPPAELLELEIAEAWSEYLETTRRADQMLYAVVEEWAWARLQKQLRWIASSPTTVHPVG